MSVQLTGYETHRLLRVSAGTRVYEATRKRDGRRVVVKQFELGDEGVEARVEHEFRLLQTVEVEGVVRPLGLEHAGDQLVLLLDYVPGRNLAEQLDGRPMPVPEFLRAAIRLCTILVGVHERGVVHRDIKPSNILVDEQGGLHLADFGISVLLESERRHLYDSRLLSGTLPYISPEQTGRTSREVDFRSDLYSLGATFYEMLSARRPFDASEPLALIHAHLAREPEPLTKLLDTIPPLLADIVGKLLRKAPEHRYQSARGVQADLESVAKALAEGDADPRFELGLHDYAARLQLPAQLYGRAAERGVLTAELALAVEQNQRRMLLIGGGPGLGKSALLRELEAPVAAHGGYIASGRFEAQASVRAGGSRSEAPYQGIVRAFTNVIEQILTESDERLAQWAKRIRQALGAVAPVVVQLVPELSLVLGELPSATPLELGEARNRLHLAFARFAAAFTLDGPLVLALDDLHFADPSSLALLRALLVGSDAPLLVVATHLTDADAHADATNPADSALELQFIAELEQDQTKQVRRLQLEPLTDDDVLALLRDSFGEHHDDLRGLQQLVSSKTANNPLFVRQFLIHLFDRELLRPGRGGWSWRLDELRAAKVPDDVLAVMTAKLARLAPRERELLSRAACIGARFELATLEAIAQLSREALIDSLYTLTHDGLIAPLAGAYEFCHDQLATAARDALPSDARRGVRWALGRELLRRARASGATSEAGLGERVFEIVEALNDGQPSPELLQDHERIELAELGVEAGELALGAAAWDPAQRYFAQAIELLTPQLGAAKRGEGRRELVFAAHFGLAQATALAGRTDAAAQAFASLREWQLSLTEHSRVVARQLRILTLQQHMRAAVEIGRAELARCGLKLPSKPSVAWMILQLIRATRLADRTNTAALLAAPAIADERINAAIELLDVLKHAALVVDINLFVGLTGIHARLVLTHGYHPSGCEALSTLAISVAGTHQPDKARALCESAETLARERPGDVGSLLRVQGSTFLFAGPCIKRFRECAEPSEANAGQALEIGERESAGYFGSLGLGLHIIAGTHLRDVLELAPRLRSELPDCGTHEMAVISDMNLRFAEALAKRGGGEQPFNPNSDSELRFMSREEFAELEISKLTQYVAVAIEFNGRLMHALAAGGLSPEQTDALTRLATPLLPDFETVLFGVWQQPRFAMMHAVLLAELLPSLDRSARRKALARLRKHEALTRKWTKSCPDNYAPMSELCAGERCRARARHAEAMAHYERARVLAFDSGVAEIEGLACLRISSLAAHMGWTVTARGGTSQARRAFERWGAWALVDRIDGREPGSAPVLDERTHTGSNSNERSISRLLTTGSSSTMTLDMATVLGTLQAISEDLRIEHVITRVLAAAIENAGADRGLLVLDSDGRLEFVAEGDAASCQQFLQTPIPLDAARERMPVSVVSYVLRTRKPVVIEDLSQDSRFSSDPYAQRTGVRSLLCMPILKQGERVGALTLENRLVSGAFTTARLELLRLLIAQAASALDNARLYAALARSEAQWRSLVDGAPDIIALLDEHGLLEFINHLGPQFPHGDELRGQSFEALMGAGTGSAAAWRSAVEQATQRGTTHELEIALAPPERDGEQSEAVSERRTYSVRLTPITVAGEVRKLLAIATDITERRVFEARQRQQQRLESIGTFASGVAHEINNPVQGILNYAEILASNPSDELAVVEFAAEITRESDRVAAIVRNLLAFARQEQERQFESVAPARIVDDTLSLMRAVIRKDQVQLEVDVPAQLPLVRCRSQQIQQILMNLVGNARDALNERYPRYDENKRIILRASAMQRDGRDWVRFDVRDLAGGIPEHVRVQIFDPFFTTKGRDKGTGLGLSVSHGIAVEHGGDLWFETEEGVGTVFHLDLPVGD